MEMAIKVYDAGNRPTSCKIVIGGAAEGGAGDDRETAGHIAYCDGEYAYEAPDGDYRIEVYKGKLYEPFRTTVSVRGENAALDVRLTPVADARALGLYSFDAHSHVSRNQHIGTGTLEWASTVMMAEGFDFFFAGSPYDDATHREYLNGVYNSDAPYREQFASNLRAINRDDFVVDIGNELVKCRYGHLCLLNFVQKPPFSNYYDEVWDPWNGSNRLGDEPAYEIAYPYEAVLAEKGKHSFAFSAHPTSWWWGPNGVLITNIASTLAFDLLSGASDGLVVMGYGSDRTHYQEVWFEALRHGFFVPAVAETDVSFDGIPKQKFLQYKTYAFLDEFSADALGDAMKNGRNIVSSGPLLVLKVNGELPGSVIPYRSGDAFEAAIDAYACWEAPLSKVQLIVNGGIAAEFDAGGARYGCSGTIRVERDSFVIAKCYDGAGNVAITSPVYIRNAPFANRGFLSDVSVAVAKAGLPASGEYWLDDEAERHPFAGDLRLWMSPASDLHIAVDGEVRTVKLFELDELQRIFKHLYLGDFNRDKRYEPGEVPAGAFEIARVKDILDRVELELAF